MEIKIDENLKIQKRRESVGWVSEQHHKLDCVLMHSLCQSEEH